MIFCDAPVVQTLQNAVNKIVGIRPLIYTFLEKVEGYEFADDVLLAEDDDDFE